MGAMALMAAAMLQAAAVELPSRIVVAGLGEVKSAPNIARFSYEIRGEGKTSDDALRALVATAARVHGALLSIDPKVEPKSDSLSVVGVRGAGCNTEDFDETPRLSTGACAIVGYVASQNYTATTERFADAGTMVGLAGRNGATEPRIRAFDIADRRSAKSQAIAAALANARSKAEAVALGSGVALGPMISATLDGAQDGLIVVQDEEFQLTGSRVRREGIISGTPVTVTLAPSAIETNARVTVTYSIQR